MSKKNTAIIFFVSCLALGLVAKFAFAQDPFGVSNVETQLGGALVAADPRVIITRAINIALSFLGLIVLVLIMYAGFLWMTSGGEADQIDKAKRILKNAIVGLVIVLASWGITVYLLNTFSEIIGGGNGTGNSGNVVSNPGFGAIGACTVESVYPTNNQSNVPRNTSILVTFKEKVKLDSICVNNTGVACSCNNTNCNKINPLAIKIYDQELGDSCTSNPCPSSTNITDVNIVVDPGQKTLVLSPNQALGSEAKNTEYSILLTSDIKKDLDDKSMFITCHANYFSWNFEVNTDLDLVPPQVKSGKVFPRPDNSRDSVITTPAVAATAKIIVSASAPATFAAASLVSIQAIPSGNTGTVSGLVDYHDSVTNFSVQVPVGYSNKAQLYNSNTSEMLGIADFDENGRVVFTDYFTFTAPNHPEGSLWKIEINTEHLADTLKVGTKIYTFANNSANNNILVPSPYNAVTQAVNIRAKLSGHPEVNVVGSGVTINLIAKVGGASGNDLALSTSNTQALILTLFAGGVDLDEIRTINDQLDQPMNSVIQINFNETINPVTVSGSAIEVHNQLRIVNADVGALVAGQACVDNSDCRSYKCSETAHTCVADYLDGKFVLSSNYQTVEFISNNKCGINGCGEEIYCLPANSHLQVELRAADLQACVSSNPDCVALSPFNNCTAGLLAYSTCRDNQDGVERNYPGAAINNLNGIVDAAANSLDGNRDTFADGPLPESYNENNPDLNAPNNKDSYQWSFYISNKLATDPPIITSIAPSFGASDIGLAEPVEINFNSLMMNSTLRSGSALIYNGTTTVIHHLINLWSTTPNPLGYWLSGDNQDSNSDGMPDLTVATINHSNFSQSMSFNAQVGSGIKDIYQNCYKPSAGAGCNANASSPSCCFGVPSNTLSPEGNCLQ